MKNVFSDSFGGSFNCCGGENLSCEGNSNADYVKSSSSLVVEITNHNLDRMTSINPIHPMKVINEFVFEGEELMLRPVHDLTGKNLLHMT